MLIVLVAANLLFYYWAFPEINIQSTFFWGWLIFDFVALLFITLRFKTAKIKIISDDDINELIYYEK